MHSGTKYPYELIRTTQVPSHVHVRVMVVITRLRHKVISKFELNFTGDQPCRPNQGCEAFIRHVKIYSDPYLVFHFVTCVWSLIWSRVTRSGSQFNIKMISYQYRKSHCGDKTILRPSYLHNGISYTGKMTSLYWIRTLYIESVYELAFAIHR